MPLVFHVFTDRSVGGAERVVLSLLSPSKRDTLASAVLLPKGSALVPLLRQADIPCVLYKEAKSSFLLFFTLFRILRRSGASVLVSHGCGIARLAGKCARIPRLVSFKHCATPLAGRLFFYRKITDLTIAVSENANKCLQKYGIPKQERCVIENGISPVGVPTDEERRAARSLFGIEKNVFAIGMSARLSAVKGHKTAIAALFRLPPSFHLYLLGEGELKSALEHYASSLSLSSRVHFLGFRPDTTPFYHALDAHISCSLDSETASLSLAEGMSAGCPTIASRIEGNLRRVKEGGDFFDVGDEKALASLLLRLKSPEIWKESREKALARAEKLPTAKQARRTFEQRMLELLR